VRLPNLVCSHGNKKSVDDEELVTKACVNNWSPLDPIHLMQVTVDTLRLQCCHISTGLEAQILHMYIDYFCSQICKLFPCRPITAVNGLYSSTTEYTAHLIKILTTHQNTSMTITDVSPNFHKSHLLKCCILQASCQIH